MSRTNAKMRRRRLGLELLEARELLSASPSPHAIKDGEAAPGAAVPIASVTPLEPRRPATTSPWRREHVVLTGQTAPRCAGRAPQDACLGQGSEGR